MTVTYSSKVATSSFSCFLSLLFRWRGSIYKLLWRDFAVFAICFYILSFLYRFVLTGAAKRGFEKISEYCQEFINLIPLAFVLGFYVSLVVNRWWEQFKSIPYPSRMAVFVSALVTGVDDRGRLMRRTIIRYLCLSHLMTFASISPPVKKRFPSFTHMTEAGFMLQNEQAIIENLKTTSNKYFVPLIWAASLVSRARKEGRIKDDHAVKTLIDEINEFRGKCGTLFGYDWVNVPLVYTQVVTIAVYMFFISCMMGRQFLENGNVGDLYFPFFTFLQFFFYMGWLKVAESLLNPFGEDDDDFDINGMIDKNLATAYLIVDDMHQEHPELIKDQYWDAFTIDLPYTEASQKYKKDEYIGSAVTIEVPEEKTQFLNTASSMSTINEDGQIAMAANIGRSRQGSIAGSEKSSRSPKQGRKKASKKLPSSITRANSRLSNVLKIVSRQTSRNPDIETGGVPMSYASKQETASNRNSYADELMFPMYEDDNTPSPSAPHRPIFLAPQLSVDSVGGHSIKSHTGGGDGPTLKNQGAPHLTTVPEDLEISSSPAIGQKSPSLMHAAHLVAQKASDNLASVVIDQLKDLRTGTSVRK